VLPDSSVRNLILIFFPGSYTAMWCTALSGPAPPEARLCAAGSENKKGLMINTERPGFVPLFSALEYPVFHFFRHRLPAPSHRCCRYITFGVQWNYPPVTIT